MKDAACDANTASWMGKVASRRGWRVFELWLGAYSNGASKVDLTTNPFINLAEVQADVLCLQACGVYVAEDDLEGHPSNLD